ncbi:hypothetical protein Taro_040573 [Colocasia esculenta]|uniref:Cysteine-rich receptor-like protein kinase 2 n=1 Tax=Colocasia esculenta TaxID=4460 RepID=A0A843W9B5_COLES|nr:hypothetical protein [Colocasia esculenta]
MEQTIVFLLLPLVVLLMTAPATTAQEDANSRVVELMCAAEAASNATIFLPSLIANMDGTRELVRATGFGTSTNRSDYSLAQCYRGLSQLDCMLCYSTARTTLPNCFPYIGGRVYLDGCFMRAEKYDFYAEFAGPGDRARCGNATRRGAGFEAAARQAVAEAAATAPRGEGNATVAVSAAGDSVYVLADCWRSLNASACGACLRNASASVAGCLPWSEGRALNTGCFLRYSDTNFLDPTVEVGGASGGNKRAIIVGVSVSSALVMVVLAAVLLVRIHRKKLNKGRDMKEAEKIASLLYKTCVNFKYSTLERATGSFDASNKLGQGGFGAVYKGVLADGREIAVKRLFLANRHSASDFYNEANIISSLEDRNLVRLLGCSCSGPENLLVYEFLPNKSLDRLLFGSHSISSSLFLTTVSTLAPQPLKHLLFLFSFTDQKRGRELTWEKRFEIILGIARGLIYLHENPKVRIIHRDIKASNILLDSQLRAKIADFGLARAFQDDKTHISTALAGTIGYMAPEYIAHGQLTEKADVYSFGVLLLEIVTGEPNNRREPAESSCSLLLSAWKLFQTGATEKLIDPNVLTGEAEDENDGKSDMKEDILRVVHVAHLCTQENPSLRPSASRALQMLLGKEGQLPTPGRPPFVDESNMELNKAYGEGRTPRARLTSSSSSSSGAVVSYSSFLPR